MLQPIFLRTMVKNSVFLNGRIAEKIMMMIRQIFLSMVPCVSLQMGDSVFHRRLNATFLHHFTIASSYMRAYNGLGVGCHQIRDGLLSRTQTKLP